MMMDWDKITGKRNVELAVKVMQRLPYGRHQQEIIDILKSGDPDVRGVLLYLSRKFKPKVYLEIGVRLGYSMGMVVTGNPICHIIGADLWVKDYSREPNPGPGAVRDTMLNLGFAGELEFLNGRSQVTIPDYFVQHPQIQWDLALVDGDHRSPGAMTDIINAIAGLAPGGFIVVDDMHDPEVSNAFWDCQVSHRQLGLTWEKNGKVGVIYGG